MRIFPRGSGLRPPRIRTQLPSIQVLALPLLIVALALLAAVPYAVASTSEAAAFPVAGRTQCSGGLDAVYSGLTGDAADQIEELQGKYEDNEGFRAAVFDGKSAALVVEAGTVAAWSTRLENTGVGVYASCVDPRLLDALPEAAQAIERGPDDFVTAGYSALLDAAVFRTSVSTDAVLTALQRVDSSLSLTSSTDGQLRVHSHDASIAAPAAGRYNDSSPYWGGAKIYVDIGGGFAKACTTGFQINSSTNGTVMVTAGHCSMNDNNLVALNGRTTWNGSGSFSVVIGTTEGNKWPQTDVVAIDGQTYGTRSYSANDALSSRIISGQSSPGTGILYCQYGQVMQRVCFQLESLSITNCPPEWDGICTSNLAMATGPSGPGGSLTSQGDSGGGLFRELVSGYISARGIVHGGGCDVSECVGLFVKVQTILNVYDATIVTGV